MSPSGYAFVNADMIVVQTISGALTDAQIEIFERDYAALYGAEFAVPVFDGTVVWMNGIYDPETGTFSPPVGIDPSIIEEIVP